MPAGIAGRAPLAGNAFPSTDSAGLARGLLKPGIGKAPGSVMSFSTLLYRYLFFDWLFADFAKARNPFERNATWQHNRAMRRYLPIYLRRWSTLTGIAFALGDIFELLQVRIVAACFFTGCAMTVTGMAFICALWLLLSKTEMP